MGLLKSAFFDYKFNLKRYYATKMQSKFYKNIIINMLIRPLISGLIL